MQGGIREYEKVLRDLSQFIERPMVAQQFVHTIKEDVTITKTMFEQIVQQESKMNISADCDVAGLAIDNDELVNESDAHVKALARAKNTLTHGKQLAKLLMTV